MIPKIIFTIGMMAAQVAIGMSRRIKGPRLDTLKTTTAEYGTPIPRFWGRRNFEVPVVWAEDLREEKVTNKTKGGKYEEYRYFGTWRVTICDHEIEAVTKIWFDERLVYDATSVGPVSVALAMLGIAFGSSRVKLAMGRNMRVYLGTETQEADPRETAWCEDRYGANSCPAYKGTAGIVFEEIPLEQSGNRIPQIKVEAVKTKSTIHPYETKTRSTAVDWFHPRYSADRSRLTAITGTSIQTWDVPTRTLIASHSNMPALFGYEIGMVPDGSFYALAGFASQELWLMGSDGYGGSIVATGSTFAGGCEYAGGAVWLYTNSYSGDTIQYQSGTDIVATASLGFIPTHYFEDEDGVAWAVGKVTGQNKIAFCSAPDGTPHIINTTGSGFACAMDNGNGEFVAWQESGHLVRVDKATFAVVNQVATLGGSGDNLEVRNSFAAALPGDESVWVTSREIDTSDLSTIRTISTASWVGTTFPSLLYDPVNDALIGDTSTSLTWLYLDRVGNPGITLGDIIEDVSSWVGLDDVDASALTQVVDGYSVTHGTGKDMIAPLLDIHDVDPRPHGFGVQFVNRGSSPTGTKLTEDFVREGDGPRYKVTRSQDTDLPLAVTIKFADENFEQQTNTVISQRDRTAVDTNREEIIDLTTYAATPSDSQQFADRRFRRLWNERQRIALALTAQEFALEPADVTTLSLDGTELIARLDKMTVRGSILDCEFIRDEPALNVLNGAGGAEIEGRDPQVIFVAAESKGFIIDGPLISDNDNDVNPVIYYAAGAYGSPWGGATVWRGDDGTYDELFGYVETSQKAVWGYAQAELATAKPYLWDRGNTLAVEVYGTLPVSTTEAAIDADPSLNLIAVGVDGRWEYIQYTTATLTGTSGEANLYTLSGFKRGRRGTEVNVGNHESGDTIIVLSDAAPVEIGTDDVGDALSFKIQTVGRSIDAATAIDLTYTGATLKPYAPVIWHVTKDSVTGDLSIEIRTRTRIGGTWNGSTIPTGETVASYEFDVYRAGVFKRTLTSSTKTFTYSSADQVTDGGSIAASALTGNAYQLSATVGRGFAAAA